MLCDGCKERDSVITLTRSDAQGVTELHLCERCAAERGIETQLATPKPALTDFILAVQKQLPASATDSGRCSFCSSTLRASLLLMPPMSIPPAVTPLAIVSFWVES